MRPTSLKPRAASTAALDAISGSVSDASSVHIRPRAQVTGASIDARLLQHLVLRVLAPVPGHALRCFDDILLQDGTSFAVVDALQDTFPGRFTKTSPATVELYAAMSIFPDQAIRVHLAPDTAGERRFLSGARGSVWVGCAAPGHPPAA